MKKEKSAKKCEADVPAVKVKKEKGEKKEVVKNAQLVVSVDVSELEKIAKRAGKVFVPSKKADKKAITAGVEAAFNVASAELVTKQFAKVVKNAKLPFISEVVKELMAKNEPAKEKAPKKDKGAKVEKAPKKDKKVKEEKVTKKEVKEEKSSKKEKKEKKNKPAKVEKTEVVEKKEKKLKKK